MEFVRKETSDSIRLYKKNDENEQRFLISIYTGDVPDDFDPERTCRMIEKMAKMEKFLKKFDSYVSGSNCKCTFEKNSFYHKEVLSILDFIEHGDKEKVTIIKVAGEEVEIPNTDDGLAILKRIRDLVEYKKANPIGI